MYLVIELQTTNGTTSYIGTVKATRDEAEQKYHQILAAAAVSSVEIHTAVILNPEGGKIKGETYKHTPQAAE